MNTFDAARHHRELIALEAVVLPDLKKALANSAPAFSAKISLLFSSMSDGSNKLLNSFIASKSTKALAKTANLDFLLFGENLVMVPEGFDGKYLDYIKDLIAINRKSQANIVSLLSQVNSYLATFITNKSQQLTLRDLTPVFRARGEERESFNKALSKYFPAKTAHRERNEIKGVLNRFQDIKDLSGHVKELTGIVDTFMLDQLKAQVNETLDLLELIKEGIKKGEIEAVSPMAAKSISEGLWEAAQNVEFTTVLYHDSVVLLNCIDHLFDRFVNS